MTTATSAPIAEPVYKVPQIAETVGCSEDTIYALIKEGKLRAVRLGRLIRVTQSALDEFLAGAQ